MVLMWIFFPPLVGIMSSDVENNGFLDLSRLGEKVMYRRMEVHFQCLRCDVEEAISGGRDEEIPEDTGEDIKWMEGGNIEVAERGREIGDNCG